MRNKILVVLIAGLLITNSALCQTVTPQSIDGMYSLQVGNVYFEVDPSFGARISSLKLDNTEIMFVDRSNGSYLWGSTFWQSPQSEWNWPPSVNLDQEPYTGGIVNKKIILLSQVDGSYNTHLRFRKTFYADSADTSITITYTMINTGSTAHSYSPWELTRVPSGGMTFFPVGDGNLTGAFASRFETIDGIAYFKYAGNEPSGQKMFSDGSEGWYSWVNDDRAIIIKKFDDVPSDKLAPGENEIEMWFNGHGSYIELETQGEYKSIKADDSLVWTIKWLVRKVPSSIDIDKGSTALVNYVRDVVNFTPPVNIPDEINGSIAVYPNPAKEFIRIDGMNKLVYLTITDLTGKIVLHTTVNKDNNIIPISELTDGFYIYKLNGSGFNSTGKLIVKR